MTRSSSQTAPRTRYSLQDLMLATALVALYLAAYVTLYHSLNGYDVDMFWCGNSIGLAAGLINIVLHRLRSRTRVMNCFRICLATRIDWLGLFAGLACLLAVGYPLLFLLPSPQPAIVGLTVGLTMSASMTLTTIVSPRIDFTHRGVIFGVFATLILWQNIRLRAWDKDRSGRLVLGLGFLRTVAYVPEELRDEVDALLREKLTLPDATS